MKRKVDSIPLAELRLLPNQVLQEFASAKDYQITLHDYIEYLLT